MKISVEQVVKYGGHRISYSGTVNLTLKAMYSELTSTIQLHQLLNNDIEVMAKLPGRKPMMLGIFRVNGLDTGGDGCSTIKLVGLNIFVEMDNLNLLPTKQDDGEEMFLVRYRSNIEEERGDDDV